MKKNMGITDKAIRIIVALGFALLYYFNMIEGALAYVLIAVAIIFLITSFINFCPLYSIFKINSCKIKK